MNPFNIESTSSEAWQQFAHEIGRKSAQIYCMKHNITAPPQNPEDALKMAQEAVDEYIDSI